jgi:hypothetical protein
MGTVKEFRDARDGQRYGEPFSGSLKLTGQRDETRVPRRMIPIHSCPRSFEWILATCRIACCAGADFLKFLRFEWRLAMTAVEDVERSLDLFL